LKPAGEEGNTREDAVTEQKWLACTDPQKLLQFLRDKTSDRKVRLFAVACCRHYLYLTRDHRVGEAVDVAERFADGLASGMERSNARKAAQQAAQGRGVTARPDAPKWERRTASLAYYATARQAMEAAWNVPGLAVECLVWRAGGYNACDWEVVKAAEGIFQANLLREILGGPFRPVTLDPAWLAWNDGTVPKLAQAIYGNRAFDRLPVLADALEEAGCTNADLLAHCRGPGPHHRGCWAVDLILAKN
jgi:hypothetical protein